MESKLSRPQRGSADVPVRALTRKLLKSQGQPEALTAAAVEYTSAIFYSARYPNVRDYHLARAERKARNLGLNDEQITQASGFATDAVEVYGQLSQEELDLETLSPQALAIWRQEHELREERERKQKRGKLRDRLVRNFQNLMAPSDHLIMVMNAGNVHVVKSDSIYRVSDETVRARMRDRSLTESEYNDGLNKKQVEGDTVPFKLRVGFDPARLTFHLGVIERDQATLTRLGPDRFAVYTQAIADLLQGNPVRKSELLKLGLDPKEVVSRARGVISKVNMERAQSERLPVGAKRLRYGRGGTDPHMFLDDGSHPHGLGYIQSQPKID